MNTSQIFKKLTRIAIMLLLIGAGGFLAGDFDDQDDVFGVASVAPGTFHCLHAAARVGKTPATCSSAIPLTQPFARLTLTDGHFADSLHPRSAQSLVVPLRT
jgi:hypothetical protein